MIDGNRGHEDGSARRPGAVATARVDLEALAANLVLAQRLAEGREVIAVVKADAYGHGAVAVARRLVAAGCGRLAVLDVEEAAELRGAGVDVPILVLAGVADAVEARRAAQLALTPVVHSMDGVTRIARAGAEAGRPVAIHVEVDTGMRRMGVPASDALELLLAAAEAEGVELDGAFTHLACADEIDLSPSLAQLRAFGALLAELEARAIALPSIHAFNSAGLLAGKTLSEALPGATAVRPGLMLYGVTPAPHLDVDGRLAPVMTVRAPVVAVSDVPAGSAVGYGATFRAGGDTRVATLRLGYADGYPCSAANRGAVWLAGRRLPVVGRVSMDYLTVDVGDAAVAVGDSAVVFGGGADGEAARVEALARAADTIPYEILVRVGARVVREPSLAD